MKLSEQLKKWLVDNGHAKAEATDDQFRQAGAAALMSGALTTEKLTELTANPKVGVFKASLDQIIATQAEQQKMLNALAAGRTTPEGETKENRPQSVFEKMFAGPVGGEAELPVVRVVNAHERYDKSRGTLRYPERTKRGARHPLAGMPVSEGGRELVDASQLDKAISGAYIKWSLSQSRAPLPQALRMTDHDRDLMQYALKELDWGGVIHGTGDDQPGAIPLHCRRLSEPLQKAVLDDATSGGIEAAPIVFDDQVIRTPLLYGEFFPRVNVVNLTRGRRVEGVSIGNVTLSSGGADGTNIPLFATASFIAAFDTNIFVANGAIEIGLDFLSDSPIAVADIVTKTYGEQLLSWLDEQVCVGDGTTEPEGVTVATGTTSVNAANGATGPHTVGDYEGLLFGVAKQYKAGATRDRITYGGNETAYRRLRSIQVGTTDARRIFGMTHEDYTVFDHPYGICDHFSNRQVVFAVWSRYRMYRRLGITLRTTTEGETLVRANYMLISARARFGGRLEDGAAAAVCADFQT